MIGSGSWRRALAPMMLCAGMLLVPAHVYAAGGAFVVDDAEIGNPGDCNVDAWTSFGSNNDVVASVAPACVVKLGIPVELGAQLQRSRADGVWGTGGGVSGKINLIPIANHPFGLGLAGGAGWDLVTGAHTGAFMYLPVTFALHENLRLNVNAGWLHDSTTGIGYLTWGAGFEWNFVKPLTLIGEVFGQAGNLPPVEVDEPPSPNSLRQPRLQLGLRYTPQDYVDFDLIWGHNITGENAHWLTVGVNLRF